MRLGVDCELGPVPQSVLRQLARPAPSAASAPARGDASGRAARGERPQRLRDSPAAQELLCLLDTQPSERAAWLARLRVAVTEAFGSSPDLAAAARHGLSGVESALWAEKAAAREAAFGELDALLFGLSEAKRRLDAERGRP